MYVYNKFHFHQFLTNVVRKQLLDPIGYPNVVSLMGNFKHGGSDKFQYDEHVPIKRGARHYIFMRLQWLHLANGVAQAPDQKVKRFKRFIPMETTGYTEPFNARDRPLVSTVICNPACPWKHSFEFKAFSRGTFVSGCTEIPNFHIFQRCKRKLEGAPKFSRNIEETLGCFKGKKGFQGEKRISSKRWNVLWKFKISPWKRSLR